MIFDTNLIMVLQKFKLEFTHMRKVVKLYWFELIFKNHYNFSCEKLAKQKIILMLLWKTLLVILFSSIINLF